MQARLFQRKGEKPRINADVTDSGIIFMVLDLADGHLSIQFPSVDDGIELGARIEQAFRHLAGRLACKVS